MENSQTLKTILSTDSAQVIQTIGITAPVYHPISFTASETARFPLEALIKINKKSLEMIEEVLTRVNE